jgi:hypothetical protein
MAAVCNLNGARYRHWLTHKLATWIDQFGTSGCVGWALHHLVSGGIDLTAECRPFGKLTVGSLRQ